MSQLHHLIYISHVVEEFSDEELHHLLSIARFNNLIYQLTGILLYGDKQFIQVLEGEKEHITLVYEKILKDRRHTNVELITIQPIEHRNFVNWNMGLVELDKHHDIKNKLINQCSQDIDFKAFSHFTANLIIGTFSTAYFKQFIA